MLRLILPLCVVIPVSAVAQHAAHVHGQGTLNLAIEGNELLVELIAPAHDIVGFEHAPSSDKDHEAIEKAEAILRDGVALVGIPDAAGCAMESFSVKSALLAGDDDHHRGSDGKDEDRDHAEHSKDEHDHDAKDDHNHGKNKSAGHEHDHGEKDGHAHDDEHKDGEEHSEFHATYHFECKNLGALTELSPTYFLVFPNAESLKVQGLIGTGQIAVKLTPQKAKVLLPTE